MKKLIALLITFFICFPVRSAAPEDISAKSAVLMDAASGRLLYEKNGFERLPMASTTKIMTALLVIENCGLGESVTVSPTAASVEGSSLWLEAGENLTVEQLLYGLMLKSGNDAAVALAEKTAGSEEAFVALMNARARELGLGNTGFKTPNGLDADGHHTTACDLATLTRRAMQNPVFKKIVSTKETSIPWAGRRWDRALKNHNKLLWSYDGCVGVKTGFTKKAGRCLVSAAEREGRTLICVTLNAPNDWDDHKRLLDYGFGEFASAAIAKKGERHSSVTVGDSEIGLVFAEDFTTSLRPDEAESVEVRREMGEITLPVKKGRRLATAAIFADGEYLGSVGLLADRSVEADGFGDKLIKIIKELM